MCLIAYCIGRKLKEDEIDSAWICNRDGAGVGWFDIDKDGTAKTFYEKGFKKAADFKSWYSTFERLPHVVHFRLATSGGESPLLTHPFLITKKSPLQLSYEGTAPLLFHNGIWYGWEKVKSRLRATKALESKKEKVSDSRALAMVAATAGLDIINNVVGRYAIVHPTHIEIRGSGWVEEDGVVFSNTSYKVLNITKKSWKGTKKDWLSWEEGVIK